MGTDKEVFQSVTTYKLVLRKMAMVFPKYDHVFDLHTEDGRGKREAKDYSNGEVRELDYGTVSIVGETKKRTVISSVKVIAFALSAVVIAIVFESKLHLL